MSKLPQASGHQANKPAQTIGVLIPTYRRAPDLLRCLQALQRQKRSPDDVLLILRSDDQQTEGALANFDKGSLPIRVRVTSIPGTVHAHNLGIESCITDVLAMIDDDTEPQPAWLEVILRDFQQDSALGGLGGRDRCFDGANFDDRQASPVGKLQWFGRAIGNHHLGYGSIREVDVLKGANMSFRCEALAHARCDTRLRGKGAQASEDISLALAVKREGWKIAYDPAAVVHHYQGERDEVRHYSGMAKIVDPTGFQDFAYNEVVGVWHSLSLFGKPAFVVWSLLIGTRVCPGLVQAVRFTPSLGRVSWQRFRYAARAKLQAVYDLVFSRSAAKNRV